MEDENPSNETARFLRSAGWCSFCRKSNKDVGPLVHGVDQVYICFRCSLLSASFMQGECGRLGIEIGPRMKSPPEISADSAGSRTTTGRVLPCVEALIRDNLIENEHAVDKTRVFPRDPQHCSYCGKSHKEVGPLARGPDPLCICVKCCISCLGRIQIECMRLRLEIGPRIK